MKRYGWIKVSEENSFGYSQGNYYKVNLAILYKLDTKNIILRNTYTGEEKLLLEKVSKEKARKFIESYIKSHIVYN